MHTMEHTMETLPLSEMDSSQKRKLIAIVHEIMDSLHIELFTRGIRTATGLLVELDDYGTPYRLATPWGLTTFTSRILDDRERVAALYSSWQVHPYVSGDGNDIFASGKVLSVVRWNGTVLPVANDMSYNARRAEALQPHILRADWGKHLPNS